jgi:ERCC4-type nuclease
MNFIEIVADNREMKSGVLTHLSALPGVHLEWKDLTVGDYIVVGEAIFERKSASDFAASLNDQRLF